VSDLQDSLNRGFAAIEPGPVPVEAAMAAGKRIRNRRRAGVLAGAIAVVAAAVLGVPVVAHQLALPSPPASGVRMTVNPPGPHARAGTIASGLDGNQPWSAGIAYPGTAKCVIFGTDVIDFNCKGMLPTANGDPIAFPDFGDPDNNSSKTNRFSFLLELGLVEPDVTSARVVLADGTVLTLHPVLVGGSRWVAFVAPAGVPVDSVTAYSRTGEIATTFPFSLANTRFPVFGQWLPPGQAVPKQATVTINAGVVNGAAWQAVAFVGPWGTCVGDGKDAGGFTCFASTQSLGTKLIGTGPGVWWGSAADSVSSVVITLTDGSTRRVGVTEVGRQRFWAFYLGNPADVGARWAAYDGAGQQVASGSVSEPVPPGSAR
jgi:hypothetical protein